MRYWSTVRVERLVTNGQRISTTSVKERSRFLGRRHILSFNSTWTAPITFHSPEYRHKNRHVAVQDAQTRQAWRLIPCCESHEKFRDSPNLDSECLIHFSRKGRKTFTVIYYAFLVLQENDSGVAQNAVRKGALLTTFTPLISALAVKVDLSPAFPGHFLSGECFWESPNLLSGQTLRKALR